MDKIIQNIFNFIGLFFDGLFCVYLLLLMLGIYFAVSVFYNRSLGMAILALVLIIISIILMIKRGKKFFAKANMEAGKTDAGLKQENK